MILSPYIDARIKVRLGEMYLNKVKPTIQRSRDGILRSYIPWKTSYRTGYVLGTWQEALNQNDAILHDLKECVKYHPSEYVGIVGVDDSNVPVDVLVYHDPN